MLKFAGHVELPPHVKSDGSDGFDHAAVHRRTARVYVAHTANDTIDVIDIATRQFVESIPDLPAVAGALVSDEHDLVFTSNRGENTVGVFAPKDTPAVTKVGVGVRPNGLAYDPSRRHLLAANVGNPALANSFTVTLVDVDKNAMIADLPVAGRTRWTVFDPERGVFYVNIMDPSQIAVVNSGTPAVERVIPIPSVGAHGLDIDVTTRRLFCACDGKELIVVHADSGKVLDHQAIAGVPDVVFFNPVLHHLYVAIGDPGVIEVFDTDRMQRLETVTTEQGAHTLAFDASSNTVYAFLPETHRAAIYLDRN